MDYSEIGNRIRNKRKELNMPQEKLAELVDISVTHMSHIETGSTKLSLPVLVKVANSLNISTDELLCDNLIPAKHIFNNEIANILEKCNDTELRIIVDIVKSTKQSLDKHLDL